MLIIYGRCLMSQNHMSQNHVFLLTDFHTTGRVGFGNAMKILYLCIVKN